MEERQRPLTFGRAKALLGQIIARGRDDDIDDALLGYYINAAEMFISMEVGNAAYWLEMTESFSLSAETITLDPQIGKVISVRDEANVNPLTYLDRARWNDYITTPSETTGTPLYWTRFGFVRRDNTQSPTQHYGQLQLSFWPVPTSAVTLYRDVTLRPGSMENDDDSSILPPGHHIGLVEVAAWQCGAFDVGSKSYQQHKELAQVWLMTIKREANRQPQGNVRLIARDDHERRRMSAAIIPPTRLGQLRGG